MFTYSDLMAPQLIINMFLLINLRDLFHPGVYILNNLFIHPVFIYLNIAVS